MTSSDNAIENRKYKFHPIQNLSNSKISKSVKIKKQKHHHINKNNIVENNNVSISEIHNKDKHICNKSNREIITLQSTTEYNEVSLWTMGYLIDKLYLHLIKFIDYKGARKYEDQARYLLYRIPIYKPIPEFIVHLCDLTVRLKRELASLSESSLNTVMKEAVGRLFSNIDERYYLLSVRKLVKWRFE